MKKRNKVIFTFPEFLLGMFWFSVFYLVFYGFMYLLQQYILIYCPPK